MNAMKLFVKIKAILGFLLFSAVAVHAQENKSYVYTDASTFPIYGKAVPNTSATYERLPASLEGVIRQPVWNLAHHSAGITTGGSVGGSGAAIRALP